MSKRINRDDVDKFFDSDIYLPSRILYMGSQTVDSDGESGVDAAMAAKMIKGLQILDSTAPAGDKPITILMNNPGGDTYDGLAIYDAIKNCLNHVTIVVLGKAMSMGGIILQAADKRIMSANSRLMIHYGSFSMDANAKDVYAWTEDNKKIDRLMEDIFLKKIKEKNPRITKRQLQDMLQNDFIVDAKEAVALGFADDILGGPIDE